MCARSDGGKVKPSARKALAKCDVLFLSSLNGDSIVAREQFEEWRDSLSIDLDFESLPIFTREDLPELRSLISERVELSKARLAATRVLALRNKDVSLATQS
jgi:hypothetical protein